MHANRTVGLLFVLAILAGAAIWASGLGGTAEVAPVALPSNAPGTSPDAGNPDRANAEPGAAGAESTRSPAAVDPAAAARTAIAVAGTGALIGIVQDDANQPIAGASVSCTPGFDFRDFGGGPRGADLDPGEIGKRVAAMDQDRVEATTDQDGRFRIVPKGTASSVTLRVRQRGFVALDRNERRPATTDTDLGVLPLTRGGVVAGRVLDRQGGPIAGAQVSPAMRGPGRAGPPGTPGADFDPRGMAAMFEDLEFPGRELFERFAGGGVVTDGEGRFELAHVAAGELALRARHPDHPPGRLDNLTLNAGQTLTDLQIVLEPGATIRGRVLDGPADLTKLRVNSARKREAAPGTADGANDMMAMMREMGDMAAEAGIGIGEKNVAVAADGTFAIRGLPMATTHRVWLSQGGGALAALTICSQRVEVDAGAAAVELRYDPGVTVTFQVVDARTGAPIERLWVQQRLAGSGGIEDMVGMMGRGGMGNSGPRDHADGRVTLANLRPKKKQTLNLTIDALGYARGERGEIALPTVGELDLGRIQLQPIPRVLVTVTDVEGKPVVGANVSLREPQGDDAGARNVPGNLEDLAQLGERLGRGMGPGGRGSGPRSARTDENGTCQLNSFPGAAAILRVRADEFAPFQGTATTLPADQDHAWPVQLLRGGTAAIAVLDSTGKPAARARVEHVTPAGDRDNRTTDQDGNTSFERLAPGAHRFRVARNNGRGEMLGQLVGGVGDSDAGWETLVIVDQQTAALTLGKAATATIRGLVRQNARPLEGARIVLLEGPGDGGGQVANEQLAQVMAEIGGGGGRRARSAPDGSYKLDGAPTGAHRLQVSHRDRAATTTVAVTLAPGENQFDIELDMTSVRGVVRDPAGAPVAGATISVVNPGRGNDGDLIAEGMAQFGMGRQGGGGIKTAADGTFELPGVPTDRAFVVEAKAKDFAAVRSEPLTVARGTVPGDITLQLLAAGKIKARTSGGSMLGAVRATWAGDGADQGKVPGAMQPIRTGSCTLSGLRPGRWRVELVGMNGSSEPKYVDVVAGETVEVSL